MVWVNLRKGGTHLHISYGETHTNHLSARDVRVRTAPSLEISLDLSHNLRVRNKRRSSYYDARDLADGKIERLKILEIHDKHVIEGLRWALKHVSPLPPEWTLNVELEGPHTFNVRPELGPSKASLVLRVLGTASG